MSASTSTVWAAASLNLTVTGFVATLAFLSLTNQWEINEKLGQHTSTLSTLAAEVRSNNTKVDELVERMRISQTDVKALLASAGVATREDVGMQMIGTAVVLFPSTGEAVQSLQEAGYQPVQITPVISGYTVDAAAAAIVESSVTGSAPPE